MHKLQKQLESRRCIKPHATFKTCSFESFNHSNNELHFHVPCWKNWVAKNLSGLEKIYELNLIHLVVKILFCFCIIIEALTQKNVKAFCFPLNMQLYAFISMGSKTMWSLSKFSSYQVLYFYKNKMKIKLHFSFGLNKDIR